MNKQVLNRQTITLQNKISESGKLSDFLTEYAKTFEISDEIYHDLRLVIEEAFVNIASYAYAEEDQQTVTIELSHTSNEISITFTDTGIAFNPLTDPAESKGTNDHCEGGMGIHLIKSLTDQQEYNRIKQRNVFTVTKYYTK
jgi:anti-sigma regulatory factor (Ser/Thr protein kinase)